MILRNPEPRLQLVIDDHEAKRVRTALLCTDVDALPKVAGAGDIYERDGVSLQRMHNGVEIVEGCYGGQWMTEIIRSLRGHHEPQEEAVFDAVVRRLAADTTNPTMIEFGSFWTYYGMWFAHELPTARVIAMEPDPQNLEVGKRNAAINGLDDRITFLQGAIGAQPGATFQFQAESDGRPYEVAQYDLESLMQSTGLEHIDLALVDVQGAETVLLNRGLGDFAALRVRFMIVSTHHVSISGDPLTHQQALNLLKSVGAHIIAEHSVPESFSGDGLIAVSFDARDADLTVPITFARSKDSLFDEVEYELSASRNLLADAQREVNTLRAERDSVFETRLWRWTRPARETYQRVRGARG